MKIEEFEELYRLHAPAVLAFARRCAGHSGVAEEIASEAFLELFRHHERIDSAQLPSWLFTVVRNRAVDYWRKQKRETVLTPAHLQTAAPQTPALDQSLLDDPNLNASHRACLTLRYVHGMSRHEIAALTGLRENQVKGYLRYALELLRKNHGVTLDGGDQ